ncbi:MAG: GSCFA domain-containing protein [Allomuricauda sp.]
MELQTTIPLQKADNAIDYQSKLVLLGSCFVENMGERIHYYQFQHLQNPFGILFQPLALENLVHRALNGQPYQVHEVFEQKGIWHCFDAHSEIRSESQQGLLQQLNKALDETRDWLESASHIIITLGTAWAYEQKATNALVANCHKVPQKEFSKKLLSADMVQASLESIVKMVKTANPKAQIIFTISPVRHLKDGFVENQQSKANLITAVHGLLSSRAQSGDPSYFPSYEIMMDELRDYRFYGKDMVHPSTLAVDYIWEKFASIWISEYCRDVMEEVDGVRKGLQHRPFNPETEAHQVFKKSLQAKITYLQERYPFMKFE